MDVHNVVHVHQRMKRVATEVQMVHRKKEHVGLAVKYQQLNHYHLVQLAEYVSHVVARSMNFMDIITVGIANILLCQFVVSVVEMDIVVTMVSVIFAMADKLVIVSKRLKIKVV